jgi:aspartyl-tRNA(Asn)/glutamyl-tRNA(Gln) amidotransferase subunit B
MANDYRYFPEPDLPPLKLSNEYVEGIRKSLPVLPAQLYHKYTEQLSLTAYDASVITADRDTAFYFESLIKHTDHYKAAANWLMGAVRSYLNDHNQTIGNFAVTPQNLAGLIKLIDTGVINNSVASHKLFPAMIKEPGKKPDDLAKELNLLISADGDDVTRFIKDAIAKFPDKVKEYQKGKKGVLGLFMGEIMKSSKGKIDPQKTNQLLIKELEAK